MCFAHDSHPEIEPIEGGSLDAAEVGLAGADGNRCAAYLARAAEPSGAGMVVLPDVRGLHACHRELAVRFAEQGVDAIGIDSFGRTAGDGDRGPDFDSFFDRRQEEFADASAAAWAQALRFTGASEG
jgi:carboxymethylenebutenolidase